MTGCKKDKAFKDSGTILGKDSRLWMCCGGWFIRIDSDTLRIEVLPEGFTIDFEATYPFEVNLDWQKKDSLCLGDEIVVSRMELKK